MVNPKCIEKMPTAKVEAELEQEQGKGRQIGIWVVPLIRCILRTW